MSEITEEQKDTLTNLLNKLEARTELEACAVVTKEGLRIACAVSADVDADVYSAASAALVNLGETSLRQLKHGGLKEIIVRGEDGYTILTQAGPRHMVVGSCKKMSRMGYYLALLHRFSNKVANTLGYEAAIVKVPVEPAAPVVAKPTPTVTLSEITPPTTIRPEEVPEPVTIDQLPAPVSAESIPAPATISDVEESFDKRALFDALQSLEGQEAPTTAQPTSGSVEIDSEALKTALSPKPVQPQLTPPVAPPPTKPFTAAEASDDDLFKISDKDAVLEALKVLGWEEPEDEAK
ncbi:MAG: roadblock/LC7 domain-containing protein [Candidatus Helarchaeota archaeon]|nr:roadblock/LC7 domain-containing protein [Candidatus Helarchaeota archaeon]